MGRLSFLSGLFSSSDEQVMRQVQLRDDPAAFAQLVRRWETPILRLCARMLGDDHRAEDLKQETFARVFSRRKDFRPGGGRFSTWLWRIALNLCYDELRKRQRHGECPLDEIWRSTGEAPELGSDELSPDERAVANEERELVRCALLRLPENQRAAVALRYCEGLKLREIAEILQIPETTAASRIAVGLAQLTRILEPQLGEARRDVT